MKTSLVAAALVLLVGVVPAFAQQRSPSPLFLDGAVFASVERRAHFEPSSPYLVYPVDRSDTVAAGAFAIGTFLSPRVSVRVEATFPGALSSTLPPAVAGPLTLSTEYRMLSAAVLAGVHTARRKRVAFGYLGGVAFLRERQRMPNLVYFGPSVSTTPQVVQVTTYNYGAAVQVGMDADISIAQHFSLVPQVRVQAFSGGLSFRPGIALRWAM